MSTVEKIIEGQLVAWNRKKSRYQQTKAWCQL